MQSILRPQDRPQRLLRVGDDFAAAHFPIGKPEPRVIDLLPAAILVGRRVQTMAGERDVSDQGFAPQGRLQQGNLATGADDREPGESSAPRQVSASSSAASRISSGSIRVSENRRQITMRPSLASPAEPAAAGF